MSDSESRTESVSVPLDLIVNHDSNEEPMVEPTHVSPDLLAELNELNDADSIPTESLSRFPSGWMWWLLALMTVGAGQVIWSLYQSFIALDGFGIAWAVILFSGLIAVSLAIWRELKSLRLLQKRNDRQIHPSTFDDAGVRLDAQKYCDRLIVEMSLQQSTTVKQWKATVQSHDSDQEAVQLFERIVLSPLDQQAMTYISKECAEISLLVAASPLVFSDMLIVLWRSLRMIRKVAAIYQVRLGYLSTIRLLRQVVKHLVFTGATELVTELGTDWFHAEIAGKLSARFAQGLASGMLAARLGMATVKLCRPIELGRKTDFTLSRIRQQVIRSLGVVAKSFFSDSTTLKQTERQK